MMTWSFLWAACFSKVTPLPPHPWIDLREMLSGLAASYSSLIQSEALLGPKPSSLLSEEDRLKEILVFIFILTWAFFFIIDFSANHFLNIYSFLSD